MNQVRGFTHGNSRGRQDQEIDTRSRVAFCAGSDLEIAPEIFELAREVLSPDKFQEAYRIASTNWRVEKERYDAISKLRQLVKPPPKRPLYYARKAIGWLPGNTRDSVRYLGDFIDLLTKEMTFEFIGEKGRGSSLGTNAKRLEKLEGMRNLSLRLQRYSNFIYTPGKHDFSLPPGRRHRFTAAEVVLTAFVTMELADEIRRASKLAEEAVKGNTLYMIGGRWGSASRVKYTGKLSMYQEFTN
jgi:hypothetical protein